MGKSLEVQKAEAEKERTRQIRRELEEYKQSLEQDGENEKCRRC